ncbi:hypothetical protein [Fodinibius salsisoli]|uniref:Oxidoreductase family, NAD-binding Rossmann fold n=1 Tax=Fodinibius salsisoli TaxID=2820877 RepID=A0ABT3PJI2_9BACT|nr:hypothetical protein [Fodinibius salsisoli]MCW9706101.1 hypothetical protein [Fodinibius salsisoli]
MKIGIVGPAEQAVAWENHLRIHQSVTEVVIVPQLNSLNSIDACFLLDNSDNRLNHVLEAVKQGLHTFLIAPLPTSDSKLANQVYHASQEANVRLQFSHWPTLTPASKWMAKKITKPSFIQINRDITHSEQLESDSSFDHLWTNELAFCLRWINGAVHHIDLNTVTFQSQKPHTLHLLIRFDSGATANICVNAAAFASRHHRIAADHNYLTDCDVLEQTVRLGEENESKHLYFNRQSFDASKAAELAAMEFIKSIQLKRPTIYNGYHLMELTQTLDKINKRLSRI